MVLSAEPAPHLALRAVQQVVMPRSGLPGQRPGREPRLQALGWQVWVEPQRVLREAPRAAAQEQEPTAALLMVAQTLRWGQQAEVPTGKADRAPAVGLGRLSAVVQVSAGAAPLLAAEQNRAQVQRAEGRTLEQR